MIGCLLLKGSVPKIPRSASPLRQERRGVVTMPQPATASGGFLQTSNKWLFAVALLSLAAAAFFGVQWGKMKSGTKALVGEGSIVSLQKSLVGGDFTIKNVGEEPIYIVHFAVAYFDFNTGEMKTYQKSYKEGEYEGKEIKPDGNLKTAYEDFPNSVSLHHCVWQQ